MPGRFYLGVDGGGTHTVALLADEAGRVLGRGEAGPANMHSAGEQAAQQALRGAVDASLTAAGVAPGAVTVACLGLAGAGRPRERALFRRWAEAEHLAERVLIVVDCDLPLAAGTPEGWGVAVIAGTGSIAWGRDRRGTLARAGGWGYLLGDEGSAFALGLAALRAVAQAADGCGPATALQGAILQHWGLTAPQELIGRVYRNRLPRAEIAGLAPLVEATAAEGDAVAAGIVEGAGRDLARSLDAVARRLGFAQGEPLPCALSGGLLVRGRLVAARLLTGAAGLGWRLAPVTRVEEPALGALRIARGEIGNLTGLPDLSGLA